MNLKKETLNELSSVLNALPFGVIVVDQERRIVFINKSGLQITGHPKSEDVLGTHIQDHISQQEREAGVTEMHEKPEERNERLILHKTGVSIPVLRYASQIVLEDNPFTIISFVDITERKKRIVELMESKRRFSTLLDNLPGMVYSCRNDQQWTMEFMSDGCLELTGYSPDDFIENKLLAYNDIIHEDDRARIWDEVQKGLETRAPYTLMYRITTAAKKIRWVWEKAKGIFGPGGEFLRIEGFISDITEQKQAEVIQKVLFEISTASFTATNIDELFRSIHRSLAQILDVENFYIAMYDKKSHTISLPYQVDAKDSFPVFPAGKTMTGYVIQSRMPLLATQQIIEELARTGQIEIVGTPSKVWLGVPLIVSDEVIGVIAVQSYTDRDQYTIRDLELLKFVADQIAISVSRKTIEDSLQQEKSYLDQLFEGSPEAIIMLDAEERIIKVNSEFTRLFGYHQSEIIGVLVDSLIADPQNPDEAKKITRDLLNGVLTECETRRKHKDGHMIDVSILVTPIVVNGSIVGGYGIYRDISDRKNIEKNLIAAKEKAEESDRLKSAFLSNMSHEIRTPMNAILGFSTLLSDPGIGEDERAEFIRIIKDRGTDLMRIIDDIIDVAKIESGQVRIEIKECQINQLLTNLSVTLNEVKRKTNKTHVILNCLPGHSDRDFTILTDGNRLRQVLTNLIENALKFTDQGFVEFGYQLKNLDESSFIEFFVRDTGIGIPEEMHGVIFERFRQVDDTSTRKYGGTGLGLTISKNLIRLLGGDIRLESERGKGTHFFVTLPLQLPPKPVADKGTPKPAAAAPNNWTGKKFLIAEDEESNYFLMERMLRKTGAELSWVKNGQEAIELCTRQDFDLILMDIRMPVLDGYEATVEIKKNKPGIPIIAQTAYALKGERERSLAAGCDGYIAKPIDSRELFAILDKFLNAE